MKILVIGSGGREHAIARRLQEDYGVSEVFVYPGNAGMKYPSKVTPLPSLKMNFNEAKEHCLNLQITFVVIGPEAPLYQGWVDQFSKERIKAFGPTQAASFLEESKILSKNFMKEFRIPTAAYEEVRNEKDALQVIDAHPHWKGYVVKLSGPALGKGVVVAKTSSQAKQAIQDFYLHKPQGIEAGMVIEEMIPGREVSLFYVCLDQKYQFLASACDHKRLLDHDQGPNTGGMGAYSPANWIDKAFLENAERKFVVPTLQGMEAKGTPFRGILFLGLMVNESGAYLLEYNVRFGDPETQTFLPRVTGNLSSLLHAVARGDYEDFKKVTLGESDRHCVHVVKAAKGYPGVFGEVIESGKLIQIRGPLDLEHVHFYFAGVKQQGADLVTSGGRVLGVSALGSSLREAKDEAYLHLNDVHFEGEQYRRDIGASGE